ncbi:gliding motility-associated ABC transporter permease subunit GldF [Persicobacter psychrovividus]|uniref:Gliding motility-associated ABC transporter permease subunit GldF n=1 Tax=Persicobacter psychrovividus TaxID=387638 RepID=A0ABM7VEP6_9BACT|nr:gliding motility-associated ABC transporter permease subunit GldF [Persicobacter psychrovividus]
MLQIFAKEVKNFLSSLIAYMVMGVFLVITGLIVWVFPETNVLSYGYAELGPLFNLGPYVLMFLIPAICMRTFAEEKKTGTLELLLTKPLSDLQIILGKFTASWFLVLLAILPTSIYCYSLYHLASPVGNIDSAGITGSYFGLILLAGVFTAFGVLASSISENQIIAFILAVFMCFMMYAGFDSISNINIWSDYSPIIAQLGLLSHYQGMSKGLIDSRDLFYFLTAMIVALQLTRMSLGSRKW